MLRSEDTAPNQRERVNWGRWIVSVFRTGAAGLFATTAPLASASAHAQVAAPNAADASAAEPRMPSSTATPQEPTLSPNLGPAAPESHPPPRTPAPTPNAVTPN